MNQQLLPEQRETPPDDEWTMQVCKRGQGEASCRYLSFSRKGWGCLKLTEEKAYLDGRVAAGTIGARGDNCEGRADQ